MLFPGGLDGDDERLAVSHGPGIPSLFPHLPVSELFALLCPAAADMGVVPDLRVEGIELCTADRAGLSINPVIGLLLPFREHIIAFTSSADIAAER
jgi:hypothetical protein